MAMREKFVSKLVDEKGDGLDIQKGVQVCRCAGVQV